MISFDHVTQSWAYCRDESRPLITGFATRYAAEQYAAKAETERRDMEARRSGLACYVCGAPRGACPHE